MSRLSAVALASVLLACSCGEPGSDRRSGEIGDYSRSDPKVIRLPYSPRDLLETTTPLQLVPTTTISELDHEIGHIGDVAVFPDGTLAVLDRGWGQILIFDREGQFRRAFGREGDGPGEFKHPFAIAATGEDIVVWSLGPSMVFTVFDTVGTFKRTTPPPVEGDWLRVIFRFPISMEKRLQVPLSEDLTERLSGLGGRHFLHAIRPDEGKLIGDPTHANGFVPEEAVVRYSLDFSEVDTLAVLEGPPSQGTEVRTPDKAPYGQSIWAPRNHWAGGGDQFAFSEDAQGTITVRGEDGDTTLVVRWPARTRGLTDKSRAKMANWIFARDSARKSDKQREESRMTEGEREEWNDFIVEVMPFSDTEPEIAWLGLSGRCLLVVPWDPDANIWGTGLRFLVFGLDSREPLAVAEIPKPGARVRTAGAGQIWVTYTDSFNAQVLEGFAIPEVECGGSHSIPAPGQAPNSSQ